MADRKPSIGYVGEVGSRVALRLKLVWTKWMPSRYGVVHILKFVDNEDRVCVWWTARMPEWANPMRRWLQLRATITAHDRYQDQDQTQIKRVVLEAPRQPKEEPPC